MEFTFPEELLGSSLLVPLGQRGELAASVPRATAPVSPKISSTVGDSIPLKRPLLMSQSEPTVSERVSLPRLPAMKKITTDTVMAASHSPRSSPLTTFRTVQLELEKERELYTMHASAAAKSLDRISNLMNELTGLLEGERIEGLPALKELRKLPTQHDRNIYSGSSGEFTAQAAPEKLRGTIIDVSATVKAKFFSRKPRCLMFPGSGHGDLMITSSLDGGVQYCSMKSQSTKRNVYLPAHLGRSCFAEAICPAGPLNGFLVSTVDATTASGSEAESASSASSVLFLPYVPNGEARPTLITDSSNYPHQKSISALSPLCETTVTAESFRFLTGSLDKTVAIWDIDSKLHVNSVRELHRCHTSAVQSIVQTCSAPHIIWTGGVDCPNRQLLLLDSRAPLGNNSQLEFGHHELASMSRYAKPGWSTDGNLVALGTSVPETRLSAIHVWDVRKLRLDAPPMRSVEFNGEKRFLNCEFWPAGNVIVALSTDSAANFVDFTTS